MHAAVKIGPVAVSPPLISAPLAGFSDVAWRVMCRRAGAGLVVTEMVSAEGLWHAPQRLRWMLKLSPAEHPVAVQLFGRRPEALARAAEVAAEAGADIIDLNLGCSVDEVMRQGAGAALAREPELAARCVREMARASGLPVTCKIRAGFAPNDDSYIALAQRLVEAGAAAIAIHARYSGQGFRGRADWTKVAALVQALPGVPVVGNGDVKSAIDARRMFEQTGCAAVMIGRWAVGRPWSFSEAAAALGLADPPRPNWRWNLAAMLFHAQAICLLLGEEAGLRRVRPHLYSYCRGLPGARRLRDALGGAGSLRELCQLLKAYASRISGNGRCADFEREPGLLAPRQESHRPDSRADI